MYVSPNFGAAQTAEEKRETSMAINDSKTLTL